MESSQCLGDLAQRSPGLIWPREWRVSLAVAVLAHIGLLYGFQTAFHHPSALPSADTVIEITMTAAPAEPVAEASPVEAVQPAEPAPTPAPEPAPVEPVVQPTPPPVEELKPEPPKPVPAPTPIVVQKPVQVSPVPPPAPAPPQQIALAKPSTPAPPVANRPVGDGSLAKPGPDATSTLVQVGVRAKPNYLKNPEPPYPAVARRRRQEGTVLLAVKVSAAGRATRVELKHSSGHPALDAAALEAVPGWEFEPARLGTLKVDSEIEVPVRFELKR